MMRLRHLFCAGLTVARASVWSVPPKPEQDSGQDCRKHRKIDSASASTPTSATASGRWASSAYIGGGWNVGLASLAFPGDGIVYRPDIGLVGADRGGGRHNGQCGQRAAHL